MSAPATVNLAVNLALFSDHWNPRIVGRYKTMRCASRSLQIHMLAKREPFHA